MKKRIIRAIRTATICGCLLFSFSCKQEHVQEEKQEYETMKITANDAEYSTSYSAAINGRQDINILPQISGKIERVYVTEGQTVKKGQTLFVIDKVPYQAALMTARANVQTAKAALATAQLNFTSSEELFKQKVISQHQLNVAENNFLTAKAQLAQAEAQEMKANNDLSYTEIKSPSNGIIGMLPYRAGSLVGPTMEQPLTTVSDNSEMYVYFSITENQLLSLLRKYGSIEKAISDMSDIELRLSDGSTLPSKGRIESISGVIDKNTGTVGVRAIFDNSSKLLHSGSSGSVIMPTTFQNCIVIPQSATVQLQDRYIVYKVVDNKAKSEIIKVSSENDGKSFIVTEGLDVGDEIVSSGAGLLREGTIIR